MTASADPSPVRRPSAFAAQVAGALAHPGPALVATVSGLVNGATMVLGAVAVGWATDHLIVPALTREPVAASAWWWSALAIIGISTLRWVTIFIRGVATGRVQYRAQAETRKAVVRRYLELDLGWHRRRSTGQLLAHAVSDVDALWTPMQWAYFALGMVFMLLVALAEMFRQDVAVGCTGVVLILLVLGLNLTYQRLLAPRTREGQAARAEVASIAYESIEGGPVVRSLGLSGREIARFSVAVERLRQVNTGIAAVGSVFDPILELLPTAAVLGVLAVGAPRVESGALTVGDLVGVVYLLLTIAIPLNVISRFLATLPLSRAGLDRVHSVLSHPAVTSFGPRSLAAQGPLDVALRDVSVRRGGQTLLEGVDLDLPPGTVTAVVGHVGAGKTTLLDLATGHARPTGGVVCFDSVDVRELTGGMLAQTVAVVSQSPFLFAETIRENLTLSGHPRERRDYTDDELWTALRLAAADDVVSDLSGGLDALVGERGATLSGGQRQRICLARALLREPRLLVLDDATSALDPRVERRVLAGLTELVNAGGPTVLIAANRPTTLTLADQVAFLRGGRVVAVGRHSELLATQPDYVRIVTAYDGSALGEGIDELDSAAATP